jgi:hypothetical protein
MPAAPIPATYAERLYRGELAREADQRVALTEREAIAASYAPRPH